MIEPGLREVEELLRLTQIVAKLKLDPSFRTTCPVHPVFKENCNKHK